MFSFFSGCFATLFCSEAPETLPEFPSTLGWVDYVWIFISRWTCPAYCHLQLARPYTEWQQLQIRALEIQPIGGNVRCTSSLKHQRDITCENSNSLRSSFNNLMRQTFCLDALHHLTQLIFDALCDAEPKVTKFCISGANTSSLFIYSFILAGSMQRDYGTEIQIHSLAACDAAAAAGRGSVVPHWQHTSKSSSTV